VGTHKHDSSSSSILPLILFGGLLVFAVHHIFRWDTFGFEILKLQGKEVVAKLTTQDLSRLIYICQVRKQSECLEKYQRIKAAHTGSPQPYWELANYFIETKKADKALQWFGEYFSQHGTARDAAIDYAKLLAAKGQPAKAAQYFDYALRQTQKTDPLLIRSYVQVLMATNQLAIAKVWIERVQRMSTESVYFMGQELRTIDERLNVRKVEVPPTPAKPAVLAPKQISQAQRKGPTIL
jgi:tetratricopeptide (TPR) repeat protein